MFLLLDILYFTASLPSSQDPAIGYLFEPDDSSLTPTHCLFKIHFNVIIQPTLRFVSIKFPDQNSVCTGGGGIFIPLNSCGNFSSCVLCQGEKLVSRSFFTKGLRLWKLIW